MRRKFNKCILLITVFSLISILFTSLPISATGTEEATVTDATYDEKLVVHWDFEGEGDTALANKAPNQTETEDAVIALNGTASVQNGVATLDATAGGYMTASTIGTLRDTTLVMKLKNSYIEGSTGGYTPIFNMGNTYFRYGAATNADSDGVYDGAFAICTYAITENKTNSKYRVTYGNFGSYSTDDGYRYLVCSFQYDITTAKFIEKYYLSNDAYPDDVDDFTLITSTEKADNDNLMPASYLISASGLQLGGASAMQFGLEYDDIKIYKGAMTIDEVAATITTPKCRGVQIAEGTDEFDLRFVASVETRMVSELGFDVGATYNASLTKNLSKNCTTVYKTLNGNKAGTLLEYSAEDDFNSQYIMALTVTGVSDSLLANGGKVEFKVTPYSVINGLKIRLEMILVTVLTDQDGVTDDDGSAKYDITAVRQSTNALTGSVTPPSIGEEEDPAVDYNEEFLSLVKTLTPVAAWNCEPDEKSENQIVDVVSGNAATLVGATVTEGYSGGGIETLSQTGSYLDVGTGTLGALLDGKSAVTVSMWIMPYNNYNSTNYRLISLPIDGGKGGFHLHYQSVSVKIGGRSTASDSFISKNYEYQLENDVLGTMADYSNEGQWQHIVATLDFENDNIILYVNGSELVAEGVTAFNSDTYQMGNPTEADCFGGSPRSNVYSFNGIMDNIFVFDRALNANEVHQLYTQPGVNNSPIIDELLLQSIIKRMGQEPAFSVGGSNLLCGGMVCPVDENDLTATPLLQNGEFLIPVGTASKYFAVTNTVSTVTVQDKSYQSLQQLCQANGKSLLEYQNMAVVMSASDTFQTDTDKTLLNRLVTFFTEPAATTVFTATELSRTVIAKTGDLETVGHCASPSILSVGGTIYASMDSNAKEVYVFASTDNGESFTFLSKIDNFKFATLFSLNGDLYLLGVEVDGSERYAAITKSTDGGKTWSEITAEQGRLPQSSDGYAAHSTSTAVLIANGRVYKAYSGQAYNGTSFSWSAGCTAYVESAPVDADLLDPTVWTVSSSVSFDTDTYLEHTNASDIPTYVYCQEGNVVLAPDDSVWAIYRVDCVPVQGYAIIMKLSADNQTLTYSSTASDSLISFEGGITKCTVRYDDATGKYLALVNNVTDDRFYAQRNVLSLAVSDDMVNWTIVKTILIDRSIMNDYISMTRHGFQYVDWVIDGEDILFAVREAMGESENYHNANYLTFYRLSDYKALLEYDPVS